MNAISMHEARAQAQAVPLDKIDLSDGELFRTDTVWPYLARLRREAPIHYLPEGQHGPFWSVTKYKDIMQVEVNHQTYSSDIFLGGINIRDVPMEHRRPMFIAMDPPKHDDQRMTVSPIVAPANLAKMEAHDPRAGRAAILDSLPRNETFNWVDKVSIELTTQMLATLFDFPFEDRRLLTHWSDVATTIPAGSGAEGWARREAELMECAKYFTRLWNERVNAPPSTDLISMMAHGDRPRGT
jgi:cytochrome P450